MEQHTGRFIAFEGIDGSGKSTQLVMLKQQLEAAGYKVYNTFEPTDNQIGSLIRDILKGKQSADQLTIAALFAADRLHHILNAEDSLLKKLQEGFIVLCDRYYFSSYAYHSVYVDMDWVIEINKKSAELLQPALNVFIDVDPETAMQRIQQNRVDTELYETLDMQQKVYMNYQRAFDKLNHQEHICKVPGHLSLADTATEILAVVKTVL
ncbi:MAG: dTMP kinase [Bacteroidetes bacterium]|nr:dTMP kinase [Bacteroidota bacterium]